MSANSKKIRVLIADDHPVVRKGLQSCLARHQKMKFVGEAADGDEALQKTLALSPDVVLMDITMPRMSGLAATEALRRESPQAKILMLSAHSDQQNIFRSIQAGAHGFVSKMASPKELLEAIESVHGGGTCFSPEIALTALAQLVECNGKKAPSAALTSREREVLVLIAEGNSNKEIAAQLRIGLRTVGTYRERIMRRLKIHSVASLTKFAIAHGLVSLEASPAL